MANAGGVGIMNDQIAENCYGKYSVPEGLDHRPAVHLIKAGQVYEPKTLSFMRDHAGSGDIVHAGAFFGDFIPALATALVPGAHLWAFEPNPSSFAHAEKTVALNGLANVTLRNNAVSDTTGSILFKTCDDKGNPLGGHSHFVTEPGPGIEEVASIQIDTVVPEDRRVTILQLDVEGHAPQALRGAARIIARDKPIIILEGIKKMWWFRKGYKSLGYQIRGTLHGNSVFSVEDVRI
jgi:FkbM family methyltransferase